MNVFKFIDDHPHLSQGEVVAHFKNRKDGALPFDQSTLSRKLKQRQAPEKRISTHPNALSSKRIRVVTQPDVERALILWVHHMEEKGETVSGPMLLEKRKTFEEMLKVPEDKQLHGVGWLGPFCRAYKIKEYRRHGEAGSVDLNAVETERKRIQELSKKYTPKDRFNADETSLFPKLLILFNFQFNAYNNCRAPPDRGLATKRSSGKKMDKLRISLLFACNADGSEKLPVLYIGKSMKPVCFGRQSLNQHGFYYQNNKKAWMTSCIFEE